MDLASELTYIIAHSGATSFNLKGFGEGFDASTLNEYSLSRTFESVKKSRCVEF